MQCCPCKYAMLLKSVLCTVAKRISAEFNPAAFYEKLSDIRFKARAENLLLPSFFCFCESACSNGF